MAIAEIVSVCWFGSETAEVVYRFDGRAVADAQIEAERPAPLRSSPNGPGPGVPGLVGPRTARVPTPPPKEGMRRFADKDASIVRVYAKTLTFREGPTGFFEE